MPELPISQSDLEKLKQLAKTDAGKQLIRYLQKNQGAALRSAVDAACAGNYASAREIAKSLLSDPEARELLEKFRR